MLIYFKSLKSYYSFMKMIHFYTLSIFWWSRKKNKFAKITHRMSKNSSSCPDRLLTRNEYSLFKYSRSGWKNENRYENSTTYSIWFKWLRYPWIYSIIYKKPQVKWTLHNNDILAESWKVPFLVLNVSVFGLFDVTECKIDARRLNSDVKWPNWPLRTLITLQG